MSLKLHFNQSLPESSSADSLKISKSALVALDIGTEYVKAVIAQPEKNTFRIVGVGRAHQRPGNMYAGAISDISGVIAVCEKALLQAETMAGFTAKTTTVGIAGELIKGDTTTIRYRREQSNKPITESEMQQIIERVQAKAGEKARKELAVETNNPNVEVRLINSALVSLQIDGYKVVNPIGFKGSDLLVQIYTAFAPLVHISAIEKVCVELGLDLLAVAVEPFAVCRACLGEDDSGLSALVIDVGGGTTDIAVINNGGVEGTKMFGIGGRSFTHQIATKLGIDFNTAESLKLQLDTVDENSQIKFNQAISDSLEVWLSGVQLAIEDFDLPEALPTQILLCGGGAGLVALQEALATGDWYQSLNFTRRPLVHLIETSELPDFKTDQPLDYSFVTALGLLRVSTDTSSANPEQNTILSRIDRLLKK